MNKVVLRTASGIVYCDKAEPEYESEQEAWPLQITDKKDADEVGALFQKLLNHPTVRSGQISLYSPTVTAAREALLLAVARQLLGPEHEFEELC